MGDSPTRTVGSVARRLREQSRESLRAVAVRAGMSANQLRRIEGLQSSPTEEKITGLAEAFRVPPGFLFGGHVRGDERSGSVTGAILESPISSEDDGKALVIEMKAALVRVAELTMELQVLVVKLEMLTKDAPGRE